MASHTPVWQGLQGLLQVEDWHKLAQSQTLSQERPPNCSAICLTGNTRLYKYKVTVTKA